MNSSLVLEAVCVCVLSFASAFICYLFTNSLYSDHFSSLWFSLEKKPCLHFIFDAGRLCVALVSFLCVCFCVEFNFMKERLKSYLKKFAEEDKASQLFGSLACC